MAVVEQSVVRSLPNNHPNIVRFHDAGISKADNEIRYYILSEYCPSNVLKKMSGAQVGFWGVWGCGCVGGGGVEWSGVWRAFFCVVFRGVFVFVFVDCVPGVFLFFSCFLFSLTEEGTGSGWKGREGGRGAGLSSVRVSRALLLRVSGFLLDAAIAHECLMQENCSIHSRRPPPAPS